MPHQQPDAIADVAAMEEDQPIKNDQMAEENTATVMAEDADGNNNEEEPPADDEPNWEAIMQHDPARTEVPIFLTACGRRDDANERFATGLDVLHGSLNQSTEGLVEVVTTLLAARAEKLYEFEVNLKNDYEYNEKTRANMNAKLEESARVAQGLFANLLMRVAQPHDAAGGDDAASSALGALGAAGNSGNANGANANNNGSGNEGEGEEEEPDWDAIMKHEPARTEVPTFLAARGRREAACSRFEFAIEEFQTTVDGYAQELTQTMADLYNSRTVKLDEYDQILKHDYVENDKMRAKMQSNLAESATAAHNMFEELMTRVMQPGSHQQHQQQPSASVGMLTQATTLGDSP